MEDVYSDDVIEADMVIDTEGPVVKAADFVKVVALGRAGVVAYAEADFVLANSFTC
jgi:hypothetical protein